MRVVLVGKGPPERGGIPTFLTELEHRLAADGDDVHLCNLTRPGQEPQGGRASIANVVRTAQDLARVFRAAGHADVVHVHSASAPLVTWLRAIALVVAARSRGAGTILHVHGGLVERWLTTPVRRLVVRLLALAPDRIVTVSDGARTALLTAGVPAARVTTIANGIDVERYASAPASPARDAPDHGGPSGPPTILYVGILTPRKGIVDLFDASRRLRERGTDHRLVLVGGTPDEGADAERAVLEAAPPWAILFGPVPHDEIVTRYAQADVFCLPSWWEAMPLTVLEAMAAGLPIVATDVGDVARLVHDGVHGAIVPARDVASLADALEALLRDPARRQRCGLAARAHVREHFDLSTAVTNLRREYDRVERGRPRPS